LLIWAVVFPQLILIQTPTHFLHVTSRSPKPGAVIEWCDRQPSPRRLPNGDPVLAYRCRPLGWLPFHAETAWANP
jgi:hypothetical protein